MTEINCKCYFCCRQLNIAIAKMLAENSSSNIQDRFVRIATDEEKVKPVRFGILELCSNGSLAVILLTTNFFIVCLNYGY
jgi:hypothetical protein